MTEIDQAAADVARLTAELDSARSMHDGLVEQYRRDLARLPELEARCAAHEDTIAEQRRSAEALVAGYREQIARLTDSATENAIAAGESDVHGDTFGDGVEIEPKTLTALKRAAKRNKRSVNDELAALLAAK